MTDKEKDQLVEKVMKGFDFQRVHALNILSDHKLTDKTIDDLKSRARKLLLMALDHQDREFWWAGGMHHGGICACYDNKWGLSLNYIFEANRERVPRHKIEGNMEVKVRVKKADLEKCETQLDLIELVSGEWLKQHPFKRK